MVRLSLEMCVPDVKSPIDIYAGEKRRRLLLKKGTPLTEKARNLLKQNKIEYLDFPLPFECKDLPPYTFSEETESELFRLVRNTYMAFRENAVADPIALRKEAYEILAQAAKEFGALYAKEHPLSDQEPQRLKRSIFHVRTVGALQDYLFEHAKNVALLCVALSFDYFSDSKKRLSDIHKVGVAAMFADIGMMKVPKRLLESTESDLGEKEWETIKKHVQTSADFVASMFRQKDFVTSRIAAQHHERNDGSGYPNELNSYKIEAHAKLLAVADSYHSMISKRYFRQAKNPMNALMEINQQAKRLYDEHAVKCLNFRVAPYPVGSVALLADSKWIQVVELDHIPIDIESTVIPKGEKRNQLYNHPKWVRKFDPRVTDVNYRPVAIDKHLHQIGELLDAFDLLKAYGYTTNTVEA